MAPLRNPDVRPSPACLDLTATKVVVVTPGGRSDTRRTGARRLECGMGRGMDAGLLRCAVVVMGVSGCGKSTLGRDLAGRLGCTLLDGDDFHLHASIAKMRAGEPLTDEDRWPWLDRLGAAIAAGVAKEGQAVAACSALKRRYRDRLRRTAGVPLLFVLPDAGREELARRIAARRGHFMPVSLLDSQLAALERPGADEDALVLDGAHAPDELGAQTLAWIQRRRVPVASR